MHFLCYGHHSGRRIINFSNFSSYFGIQFFWKTGQLVTLWCCNIAVLLNLMSCDFYVKWWLRDYLIECNDTKSECLLYNYINLYYFYNFCQRHTLLVLSSYVNKCLLMNFVFDIHSFIKFKLIFFNKISI